MTCEVDKLFKDSKQEEGYTVFTLEISNYAIIQLINLLSVLYNSAYSPFLFTVH